MSFWFKIQIRKYNYFISWQQYHPYNNIHKIYANEKRLDASTPTSDWHISIKNHTQQRWHFSFNYFYFLKISNWFCFMRYKKNTPVYIYVEHIYLQRINRTVAYACVSEFVCVNEHVCVWLCALRLFVILVKFFCEFSRS